MVLVGSSSCPSRRNAEDPGTEEQSYYRRNIPFFCRLFYISFSGLNHFMF